MMLQGCYKSVSSLSRDAIEKVRKDKGLKGQGDNTARRKGTGDKEQGGERVR
jgi:hypothetical protein